MENADKWEFCDSNFSISVKKKKKVTTEQSAEPLNLSSCWVFLYDAR